MTAAVAERIEAPAPVNVPHAVAEGNALMAMIERVALNPAADIDKLERLLAMQELIMARNARVSFAADFAMMQAELPTIEEKGHIVIRAKAAPNQVQGEVIQDTPYALWEDINEGIKPVLARHGFGLSFKPGVAPDGRVTVTAILMHREGHREEATMILQHDSTGSKNAVQAIGSSTSYGKRYAAAALLNLTSRDGAERDDNGKAAVQTYGKGQARPIDAEMRAEIDACLTVEDLERLWRSKPFKQEYEKLPLDWQKLLLEHFKDAKLGIQTAKVQTPPGFVPPNFEGMKA